MKISREGIVLIKSFEGFRPRAVARPEGGWVIGYGHTASAREGLTVTEADAELLLQYDLIPVAKALRERVTTPLNQHQFDALASFAFSLGVERFLGSDVLARVNAGAASEAADALFQWPEAPREDAALRRRAAERALFIAAPGAPVTLADLLAAPLPPPGAPQPAEPDVAPVEPPADARAAALAHLLGEAEAPAVEPAPAQPEPEPEAPAAAAAVDPQVMRYSPYQAAIIGPLPALEPQGALAAVNLSPIAIAPEPAPEAIAEPAPEPAPVVEATAEPIIPAFEPAPVVDAAAADAAPAEPPPVEAAAPVEPLIIEPAAAPEPLVLTPLSEAEAATPARPLWSPDERTFSQAEAGQEEPLFEDDGALGPILRHEVEEAQPRRLDWSETGAFLVMGGIGLVSFGAAMAAFRRAGQEGASGDQTALVGWVLALIALICVGVSSFNLYQRLGRPQAD